MVEGAMPSTEERDEHPASFLELAVKFVRSFFVYPASVHSVLI